MNVAVVDQEIIGDSLQTEEGFFIVDADGFLRQVAAGHDQGQKPVIQQ